MVSSEVVEYLEGYTVDALRARFPSSHLRTATWLIAVLFSAALAECARRAVTLGSPLNKMAPAGYQGRSPWLVGTPGRIRTCDLLLRRQTLYPSELQARIGPQH